MSWRSKRTPDGRVQRFPVSDFSMSELTEEQQVVHSQLEQTVSCSRCGELVDKNGSTNVDHSGVALCGPCLVEFELRDTVFEDDKPSEILRDSTSADSDHTIPPGTSACAVCRNTRRNLCPCHHACFDHRPPTCKMKHP
jgi:hypothetical protein